MRLKRITLLLTAAAVLLPACPAALLLHAQNAAETLEIEARVSGGLSDYVIHSDDVLDVYLVDVPEMSRRYRVSPLGTVSLPLVNRPLRASGMTLAQFGEVLKKELSDSGLVTRPQLTVSVQESRLASVSVTGAVKRPQIYPVFARTKRVGELILAGRKKRTMSCTSVRFGNVLGSQGSVVPIFQEQIKQGRVKVTHPEITRFFMTIPEAVSLVLQAATVGCHGDVLVLDMGEPIRILDMARTLIRLSGSTDSEVDIVFTGLRPGEKLYEELFYECERRLETTNPKVNRARGEVFDGRRLRAQIRELAALVADGTEISIREKMREIVPQYSYESATPSAEVRFESAIGGLPQVAGSAAND